MTEHRAQYDTAPLEPETIGEILPDATQAALAAFRPRTHYDGCHRVHPECALAKIQAIENERDAAQERAAQAEIKYDNLRTSFVDLYNAIREYKVKRYSHPLNDPTGKKYAAQALRAEDDLFYIFDKYAVPNGVVENKFEKRAEQVERERNAAQAAYKNLHDSIRTCTSCMKSWIGSARCPFCECETLRKESEGRLRVLNEKAEEARQNWIAKERAEAERDEERRGSQNLYFNLQSMSKMHDAATQRAEQAEAERDELKRDYGLLRELASEIERERDAANQRAEVNRQALDNVLAASQSKDKIIAGLNQKIANANQRSEQAELQLMDYQTRDLYEIGYENGAKATIQNIEREFDASLAELRQSRRGSFRKAAGLLGILYWRGLFKKANARKRQAEAERDAAKSLIEIATEWDAYDLYQELTAARQSRARLVALLNDISEQLPAQPKGSTIYHGLRGRLKLLNYQNEFAHDMANTDAQVLENVVKRAEIAEAELKTARGKWIEFLGIAVRFENRLNDARQSRARLVAAFRKAKEGKDVAEGLNIVCGLAIEKLISERDAAKQRAETAEADARSLANEMRRYQNVKDAIALRGGYTLTSGNPDPMAQNREQFALVLNDIGAKYLDGGAK